MLKNVAVLLIGILIGAIGGSGYFYNKLNEARGALAVAKSEAARASKTLRERDEQFQKVKAGLAAAEDALREAVAARESAEASAKSEAARASKALRERDEQLQKLKADLAAAITRSRKR